VIILFINKKYLAKKITKQLYAPISIIFLYFPVVVEQELTLRIALQKEMFQTMKKLFREILIDY